MEKHLISTHQFLQIGIIVTFILLFSASVFSAAFTCPLTVLLACLLFLKYRQQQRQLIILIRNCDNMIENKALTVIDGEGKTAVLASKIDILNQRYQAGILALHQEKQTLRKQIDNLSHQLKTPLTAMQIIEEILMESKISPDTQSLVNHLYQQTTHLSRLIEQLLKLSRVESETIVYDFQNYSFLDIISEVENSLSSLLSKAQVHIRCTGGDMVIRCDKVWMMEALENIIKNCIEKTPGQPIDITASQSEFTQTIMIQDYGTGIQEAEPEKIFERFYHGKESKGAGIGLCLSKEIIQAHHGSLHAANCHGARFTIQLPVYQTKESLKVTEKKE